MNKRRRREADAYNASRTHPFLDARPPAVRTPPVAIGTGADGTTFWKEVAIPPATSRPAAREVAPRGQAARGPSAAREAQMSSDLHALRERLRASVPRSRRPLVPWMVGTVLVVLVVVPWTMRSGPVDPRPPQPSASVSRPAATATSATAPAPPGAASPNVPVERLTVSPLQAAGRPRTGSAAARPRTTAAAARDEGTVRKRLGQYASASASLNVAKTAEVWPSVDQQALGREFDTLRSFDLRFDQCDVDLAGERATARCSGMVTYVRRAAPSVPSTAKHEWLFDLRRSGEEWVIEQVSSSPDQDEPQP